MLAPVVELTVEQVRLELLARFRLLRSAGPAPALRSLRTELNVARTRRERRIEAARRIWTQAAAEVRAEIEPLGHDAFEIRRGEKWTRVIRERVMLNDAVSIEIAETKPLARRLLAAAQLPVPDSCEFHASQGESALHFLAAHKAPFVVKPAASSGGRGITTNIHSPSELRDAVALAARFGAPLVIERQAVGDVYRVLVLDGQVIDVVHRLAPCLAGDGSSTVAELIAAENNRRLAEASPPVSLPIDFDCLFTLKAQGLSLKSVPAHGVTFRPRTVTNFNAAAENETVEGPFADALRNEAERAAQRLGLRLAALDIVTPDIGRGLVECGGVLLEVNPVPGLLHHYRVADPTKASNVAAEILQRLLE